MLICNEHGSWRYQLSNNKKQPTSRRHSRTYNNNNNNTTLTPYANRSARDVRYICVRSRRTIKYTQRHFPALLSLPLVAKRCSTSWLFVLFFFTFRFVKSRREPWASLSIRIFAPRARWRLQMRLSTCHFSWCVCRREVNNKRKWFHYLRNDQQWPKIIALS